MSRRDHAAIGAAAHARGDAFEEEINRAIERAVEAGLVARLVHVGPPHKRTGRDGSRIVITGTGGADYQGQTLDSRSVAFEAKCRADRLRFVEVKDHQRADLDACARSGGVAALVYRWTTPDRRRQRTFVVPWTAVPWKTLPDAAAPGGRRPTSVGPEELAAWEVDPRALLHPRDARWAFFLAPLLAPPPRVMRVGWTPALDRQLRTALGMVAAGTARTVSLAVGGVQLDLVRSAG